MFPEKENRILKRLPSVNRTKPKKKKKSALAINAEYALFVSVTAVVRLLPLHAAYAMLDFIAWSVRHFNMRHGPRTPKLILHSGFVKTEKEAKKLALESLKHFARVYVEVVKFDQIVNEDNFSEHIRIADDPLTREFMDPATAPQIILTTGHFGNWELAGGLHSYITKQRMMSIMRPMDNPKIGRYVYARRCRYLHRSFPKDLGVRPLLQAHKAGENVTIVSDQHAVPPEGVEVKFFGHPAMAQKTPAWLYLRTHTPIAMPYLIRDDDDFHFTFHCAKMPDYRPTGNMEADIRAVAQLYTDMIEEQIRRYPTQWLWSHRRWLDCERGPYPPPAPQQKEASHDETPVK
jgi:KDO2-lipid IV(A) lauroyltransferase